MTLSEALLPEFDHEMQATRRTLERVPDDRLAWKPHEKSMTLGRLAQHLSEIPSWVEPTLNQDSLDLAPPRAIPQPPPATSVRELLEAFDQGVASARKAIAEASDEQMLRPWSLLVGGRVQFTLPRNRVLRYFVLNHLIHHRAQLGVYLRLNDIPVPAIYGPSADESVF
ncbi:MAG: DinB family protein [Bryobacterales bacterium]|nr:DinB family protein [Bryobacteraceae bacterium]MDW8354966.1 DinB family protein [Bryobacterales bacterium]